jgi:ribonuclease P protein component
MGRTKEKIKMGVWFPKKNFKKAVDRNYFKRVLRETYRLNKHLLIDNLDQPYSFMFFYQTKDPSAIKSTLKPSIV